MEVSGSEAGDGRNGEEGNAPAFTVSQITQALLSRKQYELCELGVTYTTQDKPARLSAPQSAVSKDADASGSQSATMDGTEPTAMQPRISELTAESSDSDVDGGERNPEAFSEAKKSLQHLHDIVREYEEQSAEESKYVDDDNSLSAPGSTAEARVRLEETLLGRLETLEHLQVLLEYMTVKRTASEELDHMLDQHQEGLTGLYAQIESLRMANNSELIVHGLKKKFEEAAGAVSHRVDTTVRNIVEMARERQDLYKRPTTSTASQTMYIMESRPSTPAESEAEPEPTDSHAPSARRRSSITAVRRASHLSTTPSATEQITQSESPRNYFPAHKPPTGADVTILYGVLRVDDVQEVWQKEKTCMLQSMTKATHFIVEQINAVEGYVLHLNRESFSVALATPTVGLQLALAIQTGLLELKWPAQLLRLPQCGPVKDTRTSEHRLVFSGLRYAMALHVAKPENLLDMMTRRVEFAAGDSHLAKELSEFARGGELLCLPSTWEALEGSLPANAMGCHEREVTVAMPAAWRTGRALSKFFVGSGQRPTLQLVQLFAYEHKYRQALLSKLPMELTKEQLEKSHRSAAGQSGRRESLSGRRESVPDANAAQLVAQPRTATLPYTLPANVPFLCDDVGKNNPVAVIALVVNYLTELVSTPWGKRTVNMVTSVVQQCVDRTNEQFEAQVSPIVVLAENTPHGYNIICKKEILAASTIAAIQLELRGMEWPPELEEFYLGRPTVSTGEEWRGLKVSIGASYGHVLRRVAPTGVTIYDGPAVAAAKLVAAACRPGDTFVLKPIFEANMRQPDIANLVTRCLNLNISDADTRMYCVAVQELKARVDNCPDESSLADVTEELRKLLKGAHKELLTHAKSLEGSTLVPKTAGIDTLLTTLQHTVPDKHRNEQALQLIAAGQISDEAGMYIAELLRTVRAGVRRPSLIEGQGALRRLSNQPNMKEAADEQTHEELFLGPEPPQETMPDMTKSNATSVRFGYDSNDRPSMPRSTSVRHMKRRQSKVGNLPSAPKPKTSSISTQTEPRSKSASQPSRSQAPNRSHHRAGGGVGSAPVTKPFMQPTRVSSPPSRSPRQKVQSPRSGQRQAQSPPASPQSVKLFNSTQQSFGEPFVEDRRIIEDEELPKFHFLKEREDIFLEYYVSVARVIEELKQSQESSSYAMSEVKRRILVPLHSFMQRIIESSAQPVEDKRKAKFISHRIDAFWAGTNNNTKDIANLRLRICLSVVLLHRLRQSVAKQSQESIRRVLLRKVGILVSQLNMWRSRLTRIDSLRSQEIQLYMSELFSDLYGPAALQFDGPESPVLPTSPQVSGGSTPMDRSLRASNFNYTSTGTSKVYATTAVQTDPMKLGHVFADRPKRPVGMIGAAVRAASMLDHESFIGMVHTQSEVDMSVPTTPLSGKKSTVVSDSSGLLESEDSEVGLRRRKMTDVMRADRLPPTGSAQLVDEQVVPKGSSATAQERTAVVTAGEPTTVVEQPDSRIPTDGGRAPQLSTQSRGSTIGPAAVSSPGLQPSASEPVSVVGSVAAQHSNQLTDNVVVTNGNAAGGSPFGKSAFTPTSAELASVVGNVPAQSPHATAEERDSAPTVVVDDADSCTSDDSVVLADNIDVAIAAHVDGDDPILQIPVASIFSDRDPADPPNGGEEAKPSGGRVRKVRRGQAVGSKVGNKNSASSAKSAGSPLVQQRAPRPPRGQVTSASRRPPSATAQEQQAPSQRHPQVGRAEQPNSASEAPQHSGLAQQPVLPTQHQVAADPEQVVTGNSNPGDPRPAAMPLFDFPAFPSHLATGATDPTNTSTRVPSFSDPALDGQPEETSMGTGDGTHRIGLSGGVGRRASHLPTLGSAQSTTRAPNVSDSRNIHRTVGDKPTAHSALPQLPSAGRPVVSMPVADDSAMMNFFPEAARVGQSLQMVQAIKEEVIDFNSYRFQQHQEDVLRVPTPDPTKGDEWLNRFDSTFEARRAVIKASVANCQPQQAEAAVQKVLGKEVPPDLDPRPKGHVKPFEN